MNKNDINSLDEPKKEFVKDLESMLKKCCENPVHKTKSNKMFESWVECIKCGTEII